MNYNIFRRTNFADIKGVGLLKLVVPRSGILLRVMLHRKDRYPIAQHKPGDRVWHAWQYATQRTGIEWMEIWVNQRNLLHHVRADMAGRVLAGWWFLDIHPRGVDTYAAINTEIAVWPLQVGPDEPHIEAEFEFLATNMTPDGRSSEP